MKPDDGQSDKERSPVQRITVRTLDGDDNRSHYRQDDEYQDSQGVLDSFLAHPGDESLEHFVHH